MNKIQKFGVILAAVAVTAGTSQVYAMTENWSAAVSRFLTLSGGTTGLPVGDLIEIGSVASPATAAAATTPAQLQATLTVWASGFVGDNTAEAGTYAETSALPGAGFFSKQIYLVAYNAATVGAATQFGMFTSTGWVFPASDGASANTAELSDAGLTAVKGQLSSGTVTGPGSDTVGGDAAALASAVPEPSTWALVGTGLLGLLGLRRRS